VSERSEHPLSTSHKSGKGYKSQSKLVCQGRLHDRYETYQTEIDQWKGCIGTLQRCSDRTICRKLHVEETVDVNRLTRIKNRSYVEQALFL
jgi:hypothetical protein